jgi:hypothetical protein
METLVGYAWERVRSGLAMPGVVVTNRTVLYCSCKVELPSRKRAR